MAHSANRVYWIQGLRDGQWQNLHHCESQEDAVVLLGEFVARDRFEELRLSEAAPAEDGNEPVYTEIALMRHGRLVETADDYFDPPVAQATSVIDDARREPRLNAPLTVRPQPVLPEPQISVSPTPPTQAARPTPEQAPPATNVKPPSHPFGSPDAPRPVIAQQEPAPTQARPPQQPPKPSPSAVPNTAPKQARAPRRKPSPQLKAQRYGEKPPQQSPPQATPQATPQSAFEEALKVTRNDHERYQQAPLPGFERHPPRKRFSGVWLSLVLASAIVAGVVISSQDPDFARTLYSNVKGSFVVDKGPEKPNLFEAARADDVGTLNRLLRQGADANAVDGNGAPALLIAARHHAVDSVKTLLRAGAKPTARGSKNLSVMHTSAAEGLSAAVRQMIDAGTNVNLADGTGKCSTALSLAASNGHLRTVQVLIERDASLEPPRGCTNSVLDQKDIRPAIRIALERTYSRRIAENQKGGERARKLGFAGTSMVQDPRRDIPQAPEAFEQDLFAAIESGDLERVRHLLSNRPEFIQLDTVAKFVSDQFGTGYRSAVDYALLSRKKPIAATLMNAGMVPSVGLLHHAINKRKQEDMKSVAAFLIENGVDMNAEFGGLTALMRAAHAGDRELVNLMLTHGADPTVKARSGRSAAEFASIGGDKGLHELLVVRTEARKYSDIMLGFSWFDDFEKVRSRAKQCRDMGNRYVVCTIKTTAWLQDVESVEAQFDRQANNRLVAIEIKSKPIKDRSNAGNDARRRFEQVLRSIKSRLPKDHIGVATRQAPNGVPFWEGLQPGVKAGEYNAYWSDEDKRRPIFVYLKLLGSGTKEGRYKIVIGNPFRIG